MRFSLRRPTHFLGHLRAHSRYLSHRLLSQETGSVLLKKSGSWLFEELLHSFPEGLLLPSLKCSPGSCLWTWLAALRGISLHTNKCKIGSRTKVLSKARAGTLTNWLGSRLGRNIHEVIKGMRSSLAIPTPSGFPRIFPTGLPSGIVKILISHRPPKKTLTSPVSYFVGAV